MKSIGFEKFVWQTWIESNEVLAAIQVWKATPFIQNLDFRFRISDCTKQTIRAVCRAVRKSAKSTVCNPRCVILLQTLNFISR